MLISVPPRRRQVFAAYAGGYNAVQVREVDTPVPGPSEVLVEVKAAGLNFFDIYVRHGLGLEIHPPCALGLECVGIIRQTGEEVSCLKYGDHVIVHCPQGGAFSDIVVTDQINVLLIPPEIDLDQAASLTVNYLTAYFTLVELGGLKNGYSVLIQSAAGGVGWAATQIAKMHHNVTIFGVSSEYKHSEIKKNGVDYPLTYDQVILIGAKSMVTGEKRNLLSIFWTWWETKNISPYDLIMDNKAVAGFNLNNLKKRCPEKFRNGWMKMLTFLNEGKICPRIDSVFSFEESDEACKRMGERKNIGKIILRP